MRTRFIKILKIGSFLTIGVVIYGIIVRDISLAKTQRLDKDLGCFGIVDSLKFSDNHATPSFLIEDEWRYLGLFGFNIAESVMKQDSIAKTAGEEILFLYRKDNSGNYRLLLQTTTRKVTYK